jgi:uncharacterized tellurite resistance protein B-like protein
MCFIVGGLIVLWMVLKSFFSSATGTTPSVNPSATTQRDGSATEHDMLSALASSMTVGVYCALGDGNLDNREIATLRRWKDEFVRKTPPEVSAKIAAAMETEIQRCLRGVSEDHLHRSCLSQRQLPDEFKTMTMGLAFEIVAADRKVEPSEMACLQKVARLLAISDETFGRLEEKYLKPIQLAAATSGPANASENERLLGIDPSWPKDRKLAQLTSEFAKYNARMQSVTDETRRAQCRRMLEIIGEMREELLTGRRPTPQPSPAPKPTAHASPPRTPTTPRPSASIPPPVGSKDEILIGVDLSQPPRQRLTFLDAEEARWKGRLTNQLPPAALAKCEAALQAIRRLRNVYQAQL